MQRTSSWIAVAILTLLCACSKSENPLSSSNGQGLTGKLIGWVELHSANGALLSDHSGVTVSVDGTNFSATTASNGKWAIADLPEGTYTLTFSKQGYGSSTMKGYRHVGGGDGYVDKVSLGPIATISITSISAMALDSINGQVRYDSTHNRYDTLRVPYSHIAIDIGSTGQYQDRVQHTVAIYVGTTPSVSSDPETNKFEMILPLVNKEDGVIRISSRDLSLYGVQPGTTVYIIAYLRSGYGTQYFDPDYYRTIYTGLSAPSQVVSVVVP